MFVGNYAGRSAGAVQYSWVAESDYTPVIGIRDCVFVDNRAPYGGALSMSGFSGSLVLQNVTASDNVAAQLLDLKEGGKPDK